MKLRVKKLTKKDTFIFLRAHPLGTLITTGAGGVPEPSAIYFHTEKDFTIEFVTKLATKKFKNAEKCPNVVLYLYDEASFTTLSLRGWCSLISDSIEIAQTIEKFQDVSRNGKSPRWVPPVAQISAGHYVACRIHPTSIRMRRYALTLDEAVSLAEFTFDPRV
jgi:hypothetical protein